MLKKTAKKIILVLAVMVFGGLGGIIADRYAFPYLGSTDFFNKYDFLKKASENVTVINKTEQVFVKEETSIAKISNRVASSVVSVAAYPNSAKTSAAKSESGSNVKYSTGLIVTGDGLIMIYADVPGMEYLSYKAVTPDGKIFDAEFYGIDQYSNLAFIKIEAANLTAVSFGNSDEIKPGEKIIAIGTNPTSFKHIYSGGLISRLNQTYSLSGSGTSSSEKMEGVFETDIVSGADYVSGPIADYRGYVVGITGSSRSGSAETFFQIPSNKVSRVIERAIRKELRSAPALGILYVSITKSHSLAGKLDAENGAVIFSSSQQAAVAPGSPAQKAGLQTNDIITKINDRTINAENSLPDILYQHKKGDKVELTVFRNGKELLIPVQL
ncbi:MAG TPA: hypothetical protein DIT25_02865 [Candidatus Moranbacteria bacterium]|nr:hypothetical protein [Candidatus Moranbacteria bacterium]